MWPKHIQGQPLHSFSDFMNEIARSQLNGAPHKIKYDFILIVIPHKNSTYYYNNFSTRSPYVNPLRPFSHSISLWRTQKKKNWRKIFSVVVYQLCRIMHSYVCVKVLRVVWKCPQEESGHPNALTGFSSLAIITKNPSRNSTSRTVAPSPSREMSCKS